MNPTLKNAKILIVDDNQANIDVLLGFLEIEGYYNITSTINPLDVMGLFKTFKPDLLLLDLMMPELDGFEIMSQIKEIDIDSNPLPLPILVLTADINSESKKRALSNGANDFLIKPFDLIEVGLRIKNLLYSRYFHQELNKQNHFLEDRVKERTLELEQMNKGLIIAKERAEASDKLKTAFIQNISHEMRTPLNGILGFGNLLTNPNISSAEKQEYMPLLKASCNRLLNTITDYIDISLLVSNNMELEISTVNLHDEIAELNNKYQEICKTKGLYLDIIIPKDKENYVIQTDSSLLQKTLSHLIDNAIKFTNKGTVTIGYHIESDVLTVYVKDTGIGIEKDAQERIFESFMQESFSLNRGFEGSGLGLSIVKGITNILGGKIRLLSTKNSGSSFYLSIPINTEQSRDYLKKNTTFKLINKLPVVLITDDDKISHVYFENILKDNVSDFFHATNGKEAIDLCHKHPEISMILMDIKMPIMNGFDATMRIREFNKDVVIIAQTAYAHSGIRESAINSGCNDFITKPVDKNELIEMMNKYIIKQ